MSLAEEVLSILVCSSSVTQLAYLSNHYLHLIMLNYICLYFVHSQKSCANPV
jgi:hypothetical protein